MNTTVADAKQELDQLIEARADLQLQLETATEEADADAMIRSRRALDKNSVYQYAQLAKIMRLEKQEHVNDRNQAFDERTELEEQLKVAAGEYDLALRHAEEKRIAYQTLGIKLGSLDSRIENDRQAIGDYTKRLGEHIGRWRTEALLPPPHEQACDLN